MHKLKNPRKYVERLKTRIAELKESHSTVWDLARKARGDHWFNWKSPVAHSTSFTTKEIDGLHPGDEVIMVGKITEIHQTLEGNSAKMEFKEVRVRK